MELAFLNKAIVDFCKVNTLSHFNFQFGNFLKVQSKQPYDIFTVRIFTRKGKSQQGPCPGVLAGHRGDGRDGGLQQERPQQLGAGHCGPDTGISEI